MVEEWQLAANKETKRIMMRDAMREIASIVVEARAAAPPAPESGASAADDASRVATTGGAARVLVTGKRGVGKVRERAAYLFFLRGDVYFFPRRWGTSVFPPPACRPLVPPPSSSLPLIYHLLAHPTQTSALAGIVASARLSGHIVVYHPDGDRLRKHGYYIEPCSHRAGLYNLPEIAKEFCDQLLTSHGEDLSSPAFVARGVVVGRDEMSKFFSDDQVRRLIRRAYAEEVASGTTTEEEVSRVGAVDGRNGPKERRVPGS